jgi:hypothetical protein
MKYLLALIFSLILICASPQLVYSGFWRRHAISQITTVDTSIDSTRRSGNMQNPTKSRKINGILKKLFIDEQHSRSGWAGITSLICGIFGILLIPAIAAIFFGGIGLEKNRKFRWMAIVGICLGILFILFYAALIVYMVCFF